jgi:hypothetical protein
VTRALVLLVLLLPAVPAAADHEVFYRYVVLGYVKDARGKPLAGRDVELVRDKTGFSYVVDTDDKGFFVIVVRIGDEGLGESLTLRAGGASTRLTARFDPANHTDERGTRIDLEGPRWIERSAWFRSTLANFMAGDRRR